MDNKEYYEIAKLVGGFFAFITFWHRVHTGHQTRFHKSISDELSKINDMCVEFVFEESKRNQLSKKILTHLTLLEHQLISFPFSGFFTSQFTLLNKWYKRKSDVLFRDFEDAIMKDSPIENSSKELDDIDLFLDNITNKSVILLKFLEVHLRKKF